MEKEIANKFHSMSNAFSSLALLLSCVYGSRNTVKTTIDF